MSDSSRRGLLALLIGGGITVLAKADSAVLKGARNADDAVKGSDDVVDSGVKQSDEYADDGAKQGDEADDAGKADEEQNSVPSLTERVIKKKAKKEIRKKAVEELTEDSVSKVFILKPEQFGGVQIQTGIRRKVQFEFSTSDNRAIDIFLFTESEYVNYFVGSTARTITQGTVLEADTGKEELKLEADTRYYLVVDHTSYETLPEGDFVTANLEVSISL